MHHLSLVQGEGRRTLTRSFLEPFPRKSPGGSCVFGLCRLVWRMPCGRGCSFWRCFGGAACACVIGWRERRCRVAATAGLPVCLLRQHGSRRTPGGVNFSFFRLVAVMCRPWSHSANFVFRQLQPTTMAAESICPRVQKPAPAWEGTAVMPDGEFSDISSANYKGKWLVLFFYPVRRSLLPASWVFAQAPFCRLWV